MLHDRFPTDSMTIFPHARSVLTGLSLFLFFLGGCAQPSALMLPERLGSPRTSAVAESTAPIGGGARDVTEETPAVPARPSPPAPVATPGPQAPGEEKADIALNFVNLPLPTFIQVAYGEILKKNVNIDPKVLDRKELVTIRSGGAQTPTQIEQAVKLLLKSYGIAAVDIGGLVRVVPDTTELGYLPDLRRGSALPETPLPLRPHFFLATIRSVMVSDVINWIKTIFGSKIVFHGDTARNSILLSGTPDNLKAVLEAISLLDQPVMFGKKSLRINPQFWSAEELARRLTEILLAEGYAVPPASQAGNLQGPGGVRYPITILPVTGINAVLAFSADDAILAHIRAWSDSLDRPNERNFGKGYFTYAVQHTDASRLADTLERLIAGESSHVAGNTPPPATASTNKTNRPASTTMTRRAVVVDQATNTLIFQVSADEYPQLRALALSLDRPAREVLIEVTVAEVSLNDKSQIGIEWLFERTLSDGRSIQGGTLGGLGLGTTGFVLNGYNAAGVLKAKLNALASTNQASILSSPRIVARNGESASIEVGQEVPIITSQQSALSSTGNTLSSTGILQTIQYRNTGVILKVKPVIHSNNQVDLDVSQEVSAAESTLTGVNNSPTFGKRKVETRLSLKNGSTVLLGGLISSNGSDGSAGIPYLKDIPLLGNLFSNNTTNSVKTELIVLITPYIISDDEEAVALTNAFQKQLSQIALPASAPGAPAPPVSPAPAASPASE